MLFTCPRCHYTFPSAERPASCPDCGHRSPVPSSDLEFDKYYSTKLDMLREEALPSMTPDERNWTSVLLYLNHPRASYFTVSFLRGHILDATPEITLDTYKSMRWEFVRAVNEDKKALADEGIVEPEYMLRDDQGAPMVAGWEMFGSALRTLYNFEIVDANIVPGVDAVQAINLERITENPSDGYIRFLRAWLGLVSEATLRQMEHAGMWIHDHTGPDGK